MFRSNAEEPLVVKVQKQSATGFTFNSRVLYVDENEIRYYSKVPKNFVQNSTELLGVPKIGLPLKLCQIAPATVEWIKKYDKKNTIRIIFPSSAKFTFKRLQGSALERKDSKGNIITSISQHVSSIESSSHLSPLLQWVICFENPFPLRRFESYFDSLLQENTLPGALLGKGSSQLNQQPPLSYDDLMGISRPQTAHIESPKREWEREAPVRLMESIAFDRIKNDDEMLQRDFQNQEYKIQIDAITEKVYEARNRAQEEMEKIEEKERSNQMSQDINFEKLMKKENKIGAVWRVGFQDLMYPNVKKNGIGERELAYKLFSLVAEFKVYLI